MMIRAAFAALALASTAYAVLFPPTTFGQAKDNAQEREGRGALAILRRDGLLFPFASFNRDSWQVTWPIDVEQVKVPTTLQAIPEKWWGTRAPEQWRVRLMAGEERTIAPMAPQLFSIFCSRRLGLRTDYKAAQPPPGGVTNPYPKDGFAMTGNVPVEPIESMDPSSPDWQTLTLALTKEFERTEAVTVNGVKIRTGWRHPLPDEFRSKFPVRMESWYRSPTDNPDWKVSYVELVRQYPPGPEDQGCGLETLVSGWVHLQNGGVRKTTLRGKITYCDRVGATYMLPFGRIRPKDRWYWVFQLSGWEDEWYDVALVGANEVRHVIEVRAGNRMCF